MDRQTKTKKIALMAASLIGILLIFLLLKQIGALKMLSVVTGALQALIYGLGIACLLYPVAEAFEKLFLKWFDNDGKPRKTLSRILSVIVAEVILVVAVILVLILILPQLSISLNELVPSMGKLINNLKQWLAGVSSSGFWTERMYPALCYGIDGIAEWIGEMFGEGSSLFEAITTGLMSVISIVFNIFIGMILSIYILIGRETLYAQIRKLATAVFNQGRERYFMEALDKAGSIFSGFFAGKILEAAIVGVLCFFGMVLLNLPYATLISVIVGITNIIPFFGQYIGAIAGFVLLMLMQPVSALIFLIFIIILMQVDGNLIGPKVIGSHTGLPAIWVVVSILFFGGCFGFVGTLIGVPVFAWIYYVVKRIVEHMLRKRGLPTETSAYIKEDDQSSNGNL